VLVVGLLMASAVLSPVEQEQRLWEKEHGEKITKEQATRHVLDIAKPLIVWALGERSNEQIAEGDTESTWATYLLDERPALLSAIFLVLLFAFPYLCILGSFNQYAGDVGTRGIRFLLLRTHRANIYFGRYLGTVLYSALTMAILIATIVVYMGLRLDFYRWSELILWGVHGWISLVILSIPYVALCGWVSGVVDSAFTALVLCIAVIVGVPLFALLGTTFALKEAHYVLWLLPWGIQDRLLHYSPLQVVLAALACLGYAAVFLTLGYRHFAKRDL
jgi:hypothetical protein